ncbi:hypothetical protein PQ455_14690 [Sphingomonas naphthae]|uniref:Leucine-binding protein domain-containing protein n=1 Tax=Sphingomonas naphthae TaxID=1813468 RepID=A0ABY7TI32_9SPHN|nr:hypothetical protein [Sphingomonas naphthae]WCT72872.1 hypothetical protein PQ455_14690 [Sphingomonas naphthae]
MAAGPKVKPAALLIPLSGPSAALGLSMQRAAALVQATGGKAPAAITMYDTGGSAQGAAAAAVLAVKRGAPLILGPIFSAEVRAVAGAARVPILAFSNDESLRDSGAFLMGITASQCIAAIFGYARRRGVRQVAMVAGEGVWATQADAAARSIAPDLGLELLPVANADLATLRAAGSGELPQALFVADGGDRFLAAARSVAGSGVQLLGTVQALDAAAQRVADGAWIAAPDPAAFAGFARDYEQRNGSKPGAIAAIAYDAVQIAQAFATTPRLDRAMLTQPAGFPGIAGAVRFRADGSATRELAILVAAADGFAVAQG